MSPRRSSLAALPEQFSVDVRYDGRDAVVRVRGELDLHTAGDLRATLGEVCREAPGRVLVDLGRVSFLDSVGLGALVGARNRLARRQGRLELVCDDPRVLRVVRVTRLETAFRIHADLASAGARPSASD